MNFLQQCRFGYEDWHSEKYKTTAKKQWKKLPLVVDQNQIIQNSLLSESSLQDESVVKNLISSIKEKVKHITADTAYDSNPTYQIFRKTIFWFRHCDSTAEECALS